MTDFTAGTVVSRLTVSVISVVLPAASMAVTFIVFVPSVSTTACVKAPEVSTAGSYVFEPCTIDTVTGLDVVSLVTPLIP